MDYKKYELQTYECALKMEQAVTAADRPDERFQKVREAIEGQRFHAAVVGEFKRGKSSLINALLGQKVLPADIRPATATLNRVTYGIRPCARVEYKSGEWEEIPVDALADYVTKLTETSQKNTEKIRQVVVEYPTALCQNEVDIIDTPGLQDSDQLTQITMEALKSADLAVMTVSARSPFSSTECKFMVSLLKADTLTKLVIVVTYMDTVDDREGTLRQIRERIQQSVLEELEASYPPDHEIFRSYQRMIREIEIFGVSSREALQAQKKEEIQFLEHSQIPALRKHLQRLLLLNRRNNSVIKGTGMLFGIAEEFCARTFPKTEAAREALELFRQQEHRKRYQICAEEVKKEVKQYADEELHACVTRQTGEMRSVLEKRFIHALSDIPNFTHEAIFKAVCAEIKGCFQYVKSGYIEEIITVGERVRKKTEHVYDKYNLKMIGMQGFENFGGSIQPPRFVWDLSPLPIGKDLTQCEVMDDIKRAVDTAVTQYGKSCAWFQEQIGEQLQTWGDAIIRKAARWAEDREKELELEFQSQVLSEQSEKKQIRKLQLECRKIADTFYHELKMEEAMTGEKENGREETDV